MHTVPFQYELRPEIPEEIPNVYGSSDYRQFRDTLVKVDEILTKSGLERKLISQALEKYVTDNQLNPCVFFNSKKAIFHYKNFRHALRCNIARQLTGESYRLFAIRLADSALFQWFMNISMFNSRKAISKSSLARYEKYFGQEVLANEIRLWLSSLKEPDKALKAGLSRAIDCSKIFTDSTCVKANIHFPVDWVLLRDAAKSLIFAIKTIRAKGLKHRMIEPQMLLKRMNKLCISMTHVRRRNDSKKRRKEIFRTMKKLSICIAKHAKRYRQLLLGKWTQTELTEKQMWQIIRRIDAILEQLPAAIKQAHERIIGQLIASFS